MRYFYIIDLGKRDDDNNNNNKKKTISIEMNHKFQIVNIVQLYNSTTTYLLTYFKYVYIYCYVTY